jgi:hypothetical protein
MHLGLDGLTALITYATFDTFLPAGPVTYPCRKWRLSRNREGNCPRAPRRGMQCSVLREKLQRRRVPGPRCSGQIRIGTAFDVADKEALEKWVVDSAKAFGGIDIVISNCRSILH